MPSNMPTENQLPPITAGNFRTTPKELAEKMDVDYLAVSGLLKILMAKGKAKEVAQRPSPTGKGRGSTIYELPISCTLDF